MRPRPPRIFEKICAAPYLIAGDGDRFYMTNKLFVMRAEYLSMLAKEMLSGGCQCIVYDDIPYQDIVPKTADWGSFQNCNPPFEKVWLEYNDRRLPELSFGLFVYSMNKDEHPELQPPSPECQWYVKAVAFGQAGGRAFGPQHVVYFWLTRDGGLMPHTAHSMSGTEKEIRREYLMTAVSHNIVAVLYTFSMMNCRNVTLIDGGFTDDRLSNRQRREPGRGHVAYKVLKVTVGKNREYVLGRGTTGEAAALPLHVVRGHFATYSPERPMFGNPDLHGRFWIPAHARGKKEHGEIVKTYEVRE